MPTVWIRPCTGFTKAYRNLYRFARFSCESTALVLVSCLSLDTTDPYHGDMQRTSLSLDFDITCNLMSGVCIFQASISFLFCILIYTPSHECLHFLWYGGIGVIPSTLITPSVHMFTVLMNGFTCGRFSFGRFGLWPFWIFNVAVLV